MKQMVLFSPSPRSFYRVKEFDQIEEGRAFCRCADADPNLFIRLMQYETIDHQRPTPPESILGKDAKYMVLWLATSPCYHVVREFDQLEDAVVFASEMTVELQSQNADCGAPDSL